MTGAGRLRRWGIAAASVTLLAAAVPAAGCTSPAGHPAAGPPRAAIAAGAAHSLQLRPDGSVWAWGGNQFGQLGNNTMNSSKFPVEVKNVAGTVPLTGVVALAGRGGSYTCARIAGGTAVCWGSNASGQLTFRNPSGRRDTRGRLITVRPIRHSGDALYAQ